MTEFFGSYQSFGFYDHFSTFHLHCFKFQSKLYNVLLNNVFSKNIQNYFYVLLQMSFLPISVLYFIKPEY